MGIAGFFLWLQRWYQECLVDLDYDGSKEAANKANNKWKGLNYDNLYIDMNGLIHPCCHHTDPKPEPETEEEMIERVFDAIDRLFRVALPKKCLVLAIDGVAPRSKLNQQRARRFRAAQDRLRSMSVMKSEADAMENEHYKGKLPRGTWKEQWDHNQITPSTAFMERVAQCIEWFIILKLNNDPLWAHITVVFSDAHVPGEGEHKIVQYVRTCREQPGYDPNTSHLIVGQDADLICLALSTHEANFSVLRNCLTQTFGSDPDRFCVFSVSKFRERLKKDFSHIKNMLFERVIDDFIFLCFFVGNDFLPNMPLINIKAKGIETLLDHYVRRHSEFGYLTKQGEIVYDRLAKFLQTFMKERHQELLALRDTLSTGSQRALSRVRERVDELKNELQKLESGIGARDVDQQQLADKILKVRASVIRENEGCVVGKNPLPFTYGEQNYRDKYYLAKFGWNVDLATTEGRETFEQNVQLVCLEYHRGLQWVLRYYTSGCPSWEWYYPFYYAPLLEDVAKFWEHVNTEMKLGQPVNPIEQLLAVLPRESVAVLPEELHTAVLDRTSTLSKFYPETFYVDFREANFEYQGTPHLPFINVRKLQKAVRALIPVEEDDGETYLYTRQDKRCAKDLQRAWLEQSGKNPKLGDETDGASIPEKLTREVVPIGGKFKPYAKRIPTAAKFKCPDLGLLGSRSPSHIPEYIEIIKSNQCMTYIYAWSTKTAYRQKLLEGARDVGHRSVPKLDGGTEQFRSRGEREKAGGGYTFTKRKKKVIDARTGAPALDEEEGEGDEAPKNADETNKTTKKQEVVAGDSEKKKSKIAGGKRQSERVKADKQKSGEEEGEWAEDVQPPIAPPEDDDVPSNQQQTPLGDDDEGRSSKRRRVEPSKKEGKPTDAPASSRGSGGESKKKKAATTSSKKSESKAKIVEEKEDPTPYSGL